MDKYQMRQEWHKATSDLPFGVQNAFMDVLTLVSEGKKNNLVYGMDYTGDGSGACLVNAAANMLVSGGGHGIPSSAFGPVVSMFDRINRHLEQEGVNDRPGYVSPFAAEILIQWFGKIKEAPDYAAIEAKKAEAFANNIPYTEPTDEEMAEAFTQMLDSRPAPSPFDRPVVAEDYVSHEVPD